MKEYELKAWGEKFILNDSNGKFDRAGQEVGERASPEAFLAVYDKLGGLILDENKKKVDNGVFSERYSKWEEERPQYIETLEKKEQSLNEGEKDTIELISIHVNHKRAFLGTLMTISAAVIAGLFLLSTGESFDQCLKILATVSGIGFALFIIISGAYLTLLMAQESVSLDKRLLFVQSSKKDFISKVGMEITDLDSYERYREQKYEEEKNSNHQIIGLWEGWFVIVCGLFVVSSILVLILFLISPF